MTDKVTHGLFKSTSTVILHLHPLWDLQTSPRTSFAALILPCSYQKLLGWSSNPWNIMWVIKHRSTVHVPWIIIIGNWNTWWRAGYTAKGKHYQTARWPNIVGGQYGHNLTFLMCICSCLIINSCSSKRKEAGLSFLLTSVSMASSTSCRMLACLCSL